MLGALAKECPSILSGPTYAVPGDGAGHFETFGVTRESSTICARLLVILSESLHGAQQVPCVQTIDSQQEKSDRQ